jgi:hypothetical protein
LSGLTGKIIIMVGPASEGDRGAEYVQQGVTKVKVVV